MAEIQQIQFQLSLETEELAIYRVYDRFRALILDLPRMIGFARDAICALFDDDQIALGVKVEAPEAPMLEKAANDEIRRCIQDLVERRMMGEDYVSPALTLWLDRRKAAG